LIPDVKNKISQKERKESGHVLELDFFVKS